LRKTLGACWTTAALLEQSIFRATAARAQSKRPWPNLFEIQKVKDGIYAAIGQPTALINCNAAIFEMTDGLLVVDTHSKPSAVAALVAQIKKEVSPKPVKYIVNSHFHWDHSQGTAAYKKAYPQAQIISAVGTRKLLSEQGQLRLKASLEETAAAIEQLKDKLGKAKTAADRDFFTQQIKESQEYLVEMKNYTPEIPNVTVGQDLTLHDKLGDLHLAFRGRAHTAGDIIVYSPSKRVVATGDMLHGFQPWFADGYPLEWPRTLYQVAELDFDRVIGGHAAPQEGKLRLYNMANLIEEMSEYAVRGRFDTKQKLMEAVTPDKLKSLQRDGYGEYMARNLKTYFPVAPSERDADALPKLIADTMGQLHTALRRES
jgi:glyoxylase-like metal-dependent hydrolase (beta-lactamase superfamily II)